MKSCWLNNQNNENLIVFFAGWSFDEKPFKFLQCNDFDVLFVYDYNDFKLPEELKNIKIYKHKYLITWSMGVFVANLFKNLFSDFEYKMAINGTISPVDNKFGIPIKMFELTLKHAKIGLEGKFYKNVFQTEEEFQEYSKTPVGRTIENRVSELENLYTEIKNHKELEIQKFYDFAIVSDFDKIIPPKNQITSHNQNKVRVLRLPYGHFPFYHYSKWNEILECK